MLILLGLRALAQVLSALFAENSVTVVILLILAAVYIAAIVGTVQRKKWAPILIIVIGVLDGVTATGIFGGPLVLGAVIMDVLLIVLAVSDKKQMEGRVKKKIGD